MCPRTRLAAFHPNPHNPQSLPAASVHVMRAYVHPSVQPFRKHPLQLDDAGAVLLDIVRGEESEVLLLEGLLGQWALAVVLNALHP